MHDETLLRTARRRASAKFGFLIHFTVFAAVNAMLFFINQRTTSGLNWFAFPLGGWAIGLAIHGLVVYLSGSGLREQMVESELRKLESRRGTGAR